jgi:lipoate-protein ligase A
LGLLSIQKHLAESPQFNPYKWYTGGLASFHAFHAAVVLATIMMNPDSQGEFEEIREALRDAVKVFQLLARRSALCEKAVPILTRLV